jgi:hypothetical protein
VEATLARTYDEVAATKTMIERTEQTPRNDRQTDAERAVYGLDRDGRCCPGGLPVEQGREKAWAQPVFNARADQPLSPTNA